MSTYFNQLNDYVVNKTTPVIQVITGKLNDFQKNVRPLFLSECGKRGQQLANLMKSPNKANFITTALKILPVSLLIFTICCCVNTPVALLLSGLTCLAIMTQKELFSKEGKKTLLQSCSFATLLDTACKVVLAATTLSIGTAIGTLVIGSCLTVGFYIAATLVK